MPGQNIPQGPPGAFPPDHPGPADAIPVNRMNENFVQRRQELGNRLETDSRGYESVFSQ